MTTRSENELSIAQDRFAAKHGERETRRLFAAIETVVQGAPLEPGWNNLFFLGAAARIYDKLADVDELSDSDFWEAVIARENNHHIGAVGWELLWQWRVAIWTWNSNVHFSSAVGRHGSDESHKRHFRSQYDRALRGVVRSEIVSYYFDHTEHSRDIDTIMRDEGFDGSCDAHGVAAYYHRVADAGVVRDLFDEMSSVPGTMKVETFMRAVRQAYKAADKAGIGSDLRKFDSVAEDVASHRNRTAAMSDVYQRSVNPDDSSFSMLADDATLDIAGNVKLTSNEARIIIGSVVNQIQVNHNSLGIQAANSEFEQVKNAIADAPPSVLSRIFKEWLPQALVVGTVGLLMAILRGM